VSPGASRRPVATRSRDDYSRHPMRLGVAMLLLGVGLAIAGCASEKSPPVVGEDEITAAQLRNLDPEPAILRHLDPTEEEARQLAEEEQSASNGAATTDGAAHQHELHELEEEPTREEKVAGASIAILQVAVTIGAMVAPYFFF